MKILYVVLALIIAGGIYFVARDNSEMPQPTSESTQSIEFNFSNPEKSAHYETNTPTHGSVLPAPPVNVVIDFNFDLAPPSSISIKKDGAEYGVGDTVIDENKLAMRRDFDRNAPDGLYRVEYNACWPDRSCHDGHFEFAIDRSLQSEYEDLRARSEVSIRMSDISFNPRNILVSRGTRITWINDEEEIHYVNTDSHPAHTYWPDQNSRALEKGDSFSLVLGEPGAYPYHCSAHEATMKGSIVVE